MQMINILLKYILWHKFLNDLDAENDFDKKFVTKKLVNLSYSYLKYALARKRFSKHWNFFTSERQWKPLTKSNQNFKRK